MRYVDVKESRGAKPVSHESNISNNLVEFRDFTRGKVAIYTGGVGPSKKRIEVKEESHFPLPRRFTSERIDCYARCIRVTNRRCFQHCAIKPQGILNRVPSTACMYIWQNLITDPSQDEDKNDPVPGGFLKIVQLHENFLLPYFMCDNYKHNKLEVSHFLHYRYTFYNHLIIHNC